MRARKSRDKSLQDLKEDSMNRLMKDVALDRSENPDFATDDVWNPEDEDDDGGDLDIIDKSEPLTCSWYACIFYSNMALGDTPLPGHYIDVTRARRHGNEGINWPRPG